MQRSWPELLDLFDDARQGTHDAWKLGETVPHGLKRYLGRVGYLLWALRCLIAFRAFRLRIDDGTAPSEMWSTEVRILNGRYHGGVELSDSAHLESGGEIVIQAVVGRSPARLAADWYAKFFRLRNRHAHTHEFRGYAFSIATTPSLKVSIDGEVLAKTPVTVKIAARLVEVALPADAR